MLFIHFYLYCSIIEKLLKKRIHTDIKKKFYHIILMLKKKDGTKLIWFLAASIGEFKSILPIITQLNSKNPNYEFLVTTTTFSSGNLAKKELKKFDNIFHRYFPFDVGFLISKFIFYGSRKKYF